MSNNNQMSDFAKDFYAQAALQQQQPDLFHDEGEAFLPVDPQEQQI